VAAQIELPRDYDESRGPYAFDQILERVRALDGVSAATLTSAMPGGSDPSPHGGPSTLVAEAPPRGLSGVPMRLNGRWVYSSPGLPSAIGLPLVRGRDFLPTDDAGSPPVAIVSESTARGLWPGEDAIGKHLLCCGRVYKRTVIGIAPDPLSSSDQSALTGPGTFVYLPATQRYDRKTLILVRTDRPDGLIEPLRQLIVAFDPTIAVFSIASVDRTQFARAASERAARVLAASLGAIALGISLLGVYAVVSYFVTRRAREFGLRLALGATRAQVVKLVVDHSIHMILIGLLPGVLLASWGTRVFQAELSQLKPNGLDVWIAVPLIMLAAGILAAYIPARRAARLDPNKALREN
jgi:putative ABC transport system permease protein